RFFDWRQTFVDSADFLRVNIHAHNTKAAFGQRCRDATPELSKSANRSRLNCFHQMSFRIELEPENWKLKLASLNGYQINRSSGRTGILRHLRFCTRAY